MEDGGTWGAQATGSTRTDEQTDRQNMGRCCHLPRCKGIPELATSEGCTSDIGDTEDRTITNHTAILCGDCGPTATFGSAGRRCTYYVSGGRRDGRRHRHGWRRFRSGGPGTCLRRTHSHSHVSVTTQHNQNKLLATDNDRHKLAKVY